MSRGHKKQHYVSQFVLARFAREGLVSVFDKATARVFPANPIDIGHENHFLTIPDLDQDAGPGAFFEEHFQRAEGPAATAIADILARNEAGVLDLVTAESRNALSVFLALQHVRTRAARDRLGQLGDAMERAFKEVRNEATEELKTWIDRGLSMPRDPKRKHAEQILNPTLITKLTGALHGHVWLLYSAPQIPLYLSDHPLVMHTHARAEGRGYGPVSYGTELEFPISPHYLLCIMERSWVEANLPPLLILDGRLAGSLERPHIEFQRSLQVISARQFIYCSAPDFDQAEEMCRAHPELRDPNQPRVEMVYRGRPL